MGPLYYSGDDQAAEVRRLKRELWEARQALVHLMPEHLQSVLENYFRCETKQESYGWRHRAADELIALADELPEAGSMYLGKRAYCPLCRKGSSTPYEKGFSLPEGLRRHLLGFGNTIECSVMVAACQLARDYFSDKFHEEEQRERELAAQRLEQRRRVETLYWAHPAQEPLLLDESLVGRSARDPSAMTWAEQRLIQLGFAKATERNITQYTLDAGGFMVLADPRAEGKISFTVYKKPSSKRKRRTIHHSDIRGSFSLRDSLKKDIPQKFAARLGELTQDRRLGHRR